MKKLLLGLAALVAGTFVGNAATVYFQNTGDWVDVNAYAWTDDDNKDAGWPGTKVTTTVEIGGVTYYSYVTNQPNIIFNNGSGGQTKDLTVTDGAVYSYEANNKDGGDIYPIGTIKDGVFTPAGEVEITYAKIYIPVSDWNEQLCYIYSWSPSLFGGWPGKQMKKVTVDAGVGQQQSYWMIEINEDEIKDKTIGGWKVDAGEGGAESKNIENGTIFKDNYVYHLDGTSHLMGEHPEEPVDPVDYKVSLVGDMNDWKEGVEGYVFTKNEEGTYTLEVESMLSVEEFKVKVDGVWYGGPGLVTLGEKYTLNSNQSNGNMHLSDNTSDLTFSFDVETKEFSVTGTVGGEFDVTTSYALFGTPFTPGETDWGKQTLTEKDGKWVVEDLEVNAGAFGIQVLTNGKQTDWIYSASVGHEIVLGESEECYLQQAENESDHGNWTIKAGTYTFTFDPEAMTLLVEGEAAPIEVQDYTLVELHAQSLTSDDSWKKVPMTKNEETGNYEYTSKFWPGAFGVKLYTEEDTTPEDAGVWYGGNMNITQTDKAYDLVKGDNSKCSLPEGPYTFVFNPSNMTVMMTPYEGEIVEVITYDIFGQLVDGESWKNIAMEETEDGLWTVTTTVVPGEFGIRKLVNNLQDNWFNSAGSTAMSAPGSYLAIEDGVKKNWKSTLEGEYTFTWDPERLVLTVEGEGDPVEPTVYTSVVLHASFIPNGLEWGDATLEKNEDGNWEWTGAFAEGEFGFNVTVEGTDEVQWMGGSAVIEEAETEYPVRYGDNSKNKLVGNYIIIFDPEKMTVKLVPYEGELEEVVTYGIHGQITGNEAWETVEMTEENGIWTWTGNVKPGHFGIKKMVNGAQTAWYNSVTEDGAMNSVGTYQAKINGTDWDSNLDGEYVFSFNPETLVLTIGVGTGVTEIASEDADAVYFNLQGARVVNPDKGLYIRVLGGKAEKIVK